MTVIINSAPVVAGQDALADQYNDLRDDLIAVEQNSPPIGSIIMWAGGLTLPDGWLLCNGSAISRATYDDLFAAIGTTFGSGDESTTFNIPDLRDKFVVGAGTTYSRNDQGGSNTVDASHTHTGGVHTHSIPSHVHTGPVHNHTTASHQLTVNELPAHTHNQRVTANPGTGGTGVRRDWDNDDTGLSSYAQGITTENTGGNQAHSHGNTGDAGGGDTGAWGGTSGSGGEVETNEAGSATQENRPPYIGLYFIIKAII